MGAGRGNLVSMIHYERLQIHQRGGPYAHGIPGREVCFTDHTHSPLCWQDTGSKIDQLNPNPTSDSHTGHCNLSSSVLDTPPPCIHSSFTLKLFCYEWVTFVIFFLSLEKLLCCSEYRLPSIKGYKYLHPISQQQYTQHISPVAIMSKYSISGWVMARLSILNFT